MAQLTLNPVIPTRPQAASWSKLYKLGCFSAMAALMAAMVDIVLSMFPAGAAPDPGKGSAVEWFTLLQRNWFLGLRGLGILNILNSLLLVLVFSALYTAISQSALPQRGVKAIAALAIIFLVIGSIIYTANNPALPMLHLSNQYTTAANEAERSLLAASGQALLARAEDFTPGAFPGFLFNEAAGILMGIAMFRSRLFTQPTTWSGLGGFTLLLVFIIWSTFIPVYYEAAMIIAQAGGLLMAVWCILVARKLFKLGQIVS